jgi:hypothetical protein
MVTRRPQSPEGQGVIEQCRGRDHADRVHLDCADDKVFEAYREFIEQVASDAYDAGASVDDAGLVLVPSEALDRAGRSA